MYVKYNLHLKADVYLIPQVINKAHFPGDEKIPKQCAETGGLQQLFSFAFVPLKDVHKARIYCIWKDAESD